MRCLAFTRLLVRTPIKTWLIMYWKKKEKKWDERREMCHPTCLPNLAAVESDHWLEAEMSSSWICPPAIPRGYRHISTITQSVTDTHAAHVVVLPVCIYECETLPRAACVFWCVCAGCEGWSVKWSVCSLLHNTPSCSPARPLKPNRGLTVPAWAKQKKRKRNGSCLRGCF